MSLDDQGSLTVEKITSNIYQLTQNGIYFLYLNI